MFLLANLYSIVQRMENHFGYLSSYYNGWITLKKVPLELFNHHLHVFHIVAACMRILSNKLGFLCIKKATWIPKQRWIDVLFDCIRAVRRTPRHLLSKIYLRENLGKEGAQISFVGQNIDVGRPRLASP